jgi:hypothetical protein
MSMRKLIATLLIIISCAHAFAQTEKKNFYLLYHGDSGLLITQSKNDTINVEFFAIDFNRVNVATYNLSFDKSGDLIKKPVIRPSHERVFRFSYTNYRSDNIPILVSKNAIGNSLTYDEVIYKVKSDDFLKILDNFNVYFINIDSTFDNYYMAKKVKLEKAILDYKTRFKEKTAIT